jgi:hypothetical protein
MKSHLAAAAAAITALSLAPAVARSAATATATSRYAPYLVQPGDLPGLNPDTMSVARLTRPTLRVVYGQSVAHWIRSHGFTGGAAEDPRFNEPGVSRPYTGEVQAAVASFRRPDAATVAGARFLAFNEAVSGSRHRPPLRVSHVPGARLVVEYGRHTGGTASHPAAAAAIWTEGRCMLSVSVGGDTSSARESATRYAERVLYRVERRTHGGCSMHR